MSVAALLFNRGPSQEQYYYSIEQAAVHTRLSSEWILEAWRCLKRTFYAGPVEELRVTCVAGIPAVQRRVDAVSASFRKSLETTKSRVQETVQLQVSLFSLGNCIAILSSLATPDQESKIMDLIESRWHELVGEMPMKVCYPGIEGYKWRIVTGCDPKNTRRKHPWDDGGRSDGHGFS
ncbi:unnamed protein product [Cuscuta campestris]|uniref:Uncharacterized protein n=1 Tax=Cuscuta campestris TaxID=132261 RepID=A0A484N9G4_9ASTE|nr:unnamed protein product [Cuscuta campestris]